MSDVDLLREAPALTIRSPTWVCSPGPQGPTLRVWSGGRVSIDLVIDDAPAERVVPLMRDANDVWSAPTRDSCRGVATG